MIRYDKKIFQEIEVTAQISSFCGEGNVEEWHVMLHVQAGGFFLSRWNVCTKPSPC